MTENNDTVKAILEIIGRIVAPLTVITALLYYFAWVRTAAFYSHFGIDQRVLAYSFEDYLLRSTGIAFRPLAFGLLVAATSMALWYGLARMSDRSNPSRLVAFFLFTMAIGLLLYGVTVLFGLPVRKPLWAAVALGIGLIAAELASSLLGHVRGAAPDKTAPDKTAPDKTVLLRRGLIGAGLLLALFWSTAVYAQLSGERLAEDWATKPKGRPSATILSEKDLKLTGYGITATRLSFDDEGYEYKYEGLRVLVYSNSRWFLYPDSWNSDPLATVVVLRDEPTVRVEVRSAR
jgi:hypothetical protein